MNDQRTVIHASTRSRRARERRRRRRQSDRVPVLALIFAVGLIAALLVLALAVRTG